MSDTETLLTPEEVAGSLHISLSKVRKMSANRELPVVKMGRLTRFRPSDVAAFVQKRWRAAT